MWFSTHFLSQPVHCLSAEIRSLSTQPILFLPRNHAFTRVLVNSKSGSILLQLFVSDSNILQSLNRRV